MMLNEHDQALSTRTVNRSPHGMSTKCTATVDIAQIQTDNDYDDDNQLRIWTK